MSNPFMSRSSGSSTAANISVNGVKANANGNITIPVGASYISSLNDCSITTPTNAQQLTYNSTTQKWQNSSPSTFTTSLDDLLDCTITTPSNNQGLIYSSSLSKWINQQINHTTLSNIGTNTHAQIDTFISSKGQASGLATLNSSSLIPLTNIQQDMSIDLLSNSLAAFVDKNSINKLVTIY